jgi:hypothetical protein
LLDLPTVGFALAGVRLRFAGQTQGGRDGGWLVDPWIRIGTPGTVPGNREAGS